MLRDRHPETGVPPELSDLVLVGDEPGRGVRWGAGERLEQLFEDRCDELSSAGRTDHLAVDGVGEALTYSELDSRANRLARYLLDLGVGPGERVALLLDDAVHAYVGMLAVLKVGAAYVPLDVGFPADRLAFIVSDADVAVVLSLEHLRSHLADADVEVVCLDSTAADIDEYDDQRLDPDERGAFADGLAYIIYTSGSTGRPKGVAVAHSAICNFVRVAAEVYGYRSDDRVYQGLTIAFDFSVEEIWVPWAVGATLVPKPSGSSLLGVDLHEFLIDQRVTAMCCVPTLLATLDDELPEVRFLLVSGEACPHDLIVRWSRPGRRFLNVYGPTEATVTATWTVVDPDRPVTIGAPLPTYATVILDPEDPGRALASGETGEIGIAGVGLAIGYVNRDDLTKTVFVPDFLGIPDNPSGRIYRTGDLGRVNPDGEIEYLGRIDLQVKIRGYRIELTEIESVLLEVPGIAQAVVATYEPVPGAVELVGYYSLRRDTENVEPAEVHAVLCERLPEYMVPAYLEQLDAIPMTTNGKADRENLPAPTQRGLRVTREDVGPSTATEQLLAELMAETVGVDHVSADSHFFDDLGANSLLMAKFCGRVRKREDLPSISIRDVYMHPTVSSLAASLPEPDVASLPAAAADPASARPVAPAKSLAVRAKRVSTAGYLLCGTLQLLAFVVSLCLGGVVLERGFDWVSQATDWQAAYLRSLAFGAAVFAGYCLLPIVAKWLLIGRWKATEFPIWSLRYFRFWLVKLLIRANPMALFRGSPLFVLYLRALGAKIGPGTTIFSRSIPVCTDMLTIGAGTVIRESAVVLGYRAQAGMIQIGPITLGNNVLVAEKTVLEIGTSIGDGAQLGHCSSLHPGQHIPTGQAWHGSPAVPTDVDYRVLSEARCGTARRFWYGFLQLFNVLLLAPLGLAVLVEVVSVVPWTAELLGEGHDRLGAWVFYVEVLAVSLVVFLGAAMLGLVAVAMVPRILSRLVVPGKVHPLYGYHYYVHRMIRRLTNVRFYHSLFGDSSYIVHYLKWLGYRLPQVVQTGSNFGSELAHDTPYLTTVGSGTMVSDGLTVMNADYTSTSFRVARAELGKDNFLGNSLAFPVGAKVGDNCLLATKAMIPIGGPVRENVGLLGSPCFEIPRSVQRDDDLRKTGAELERGLALKNRYNRRTIFLYLLVRWFQTFLLLLVTAMAGDLYHLLGQWAVAAALLLVMLLAVGYAMLVERLTTGFRALKPRVCSIYDPYFWWHERHWKMLATPLFNGTPFRPMMMRLLGVKVGRRVFDNGCSIPEKTLAIIGDEATINEGTVIQCHSLEDGAFKSDRTVIGERCTLGVQAFVHYGVTTGPDSVIDADSFLMKGEEVAEGARWRGNPAVEMHEATLRAVIPAPPVPVEIRTPVAPAPMPRILPVGVAVAVSMALTLSIAVTVALADPSDGRAAAAVPADGTGDSVQPAPGASATAVPPEQAPGTPQRRTQPQEPVPDGDETAVTPDPGPEATRQSSPGSGQSPGQARAVQGAAVERARNSAQGPRPQQPEIRRPAVQPPVAQPPVAEPPVAEPPAQPPVAEPPAAEPPAVQPPVAEPPVAEPPAQPPVAETPAAQPPVAEPPVVDSPVVLPPVLRPPAVQPPVVRPPAAQSAVVQPSATRLPAVRPRSQQPSRSDSGTLPTPSSASDTLE
ncbi:non-ribosomal peptide synthetase [Pseudonocardia yunnanensis]|uniref:Pls/PosA family non-ribosomal peptide synthetase n=1 Tax=Pseudonocardia yunnanensis TaxID=58107 RepID=A0ABW4F7Z5_9PSEU